MLEGAAKLLEHAASGRVRERALSCRLPHLSGQLVLLGNRIRHDDARPHIQREVRAYRLGQQTDYVEPSIDTCTVEAPLAVVTASVGTCTTSVRWATG